MYLRNPRRLLNSATQIQKTTISLIPGDGIGPEISKSVKKIFSFTQVPIEWEEAIIESTDITDEKLCVSEDSLRSISRNKIALKGPLRTPIGSGHMSLNLFLRKNFSLFANVRPAKTIEGIESLYKNVDTILIRENTEGEYSGIEHEISPGNVLSIKLITFDASFKVSKFALEFARKIGRKKVNVVHKATIMRSSDGLFVKAFDEASRDYSDIQVGHLILDKAVMQMVTNPTVYNDCVLVMPNLYGDIISDLSSGLIGGLGLSPSANIGDNTAIFESVHGTAPDIAGRNLANPTALLFSSIMMLRHCNLRDHANLIEKAIHKTLKDGQVLTPDLKGQSTCTQYTDEICRNIEKLAIGNLN